MSIDLIKTHFMRRCIALNMADTTLKAYEEFFKRLSKFVLSNHPYLASNFNDINERHLREFLISLSDTMNGVTIDSYYRKLKTLFKFLSSNKLIGSNPLDLVERPRKPQHFMQTFSSEEVLKMTRSFNLNTFFGIRDHAIVSLLLSSGLRRMEFINLTLFDVDLAAGVIKVIGKGDKERVIPVGTTLKKILTRYLKERERHLQEQCKGHNSIYVFISRYGDKLSIGGADTIFKSLKSKLGLKGKKFSAHTWRHTFAKSFLLNGGDIFTLQKILGHSDITTTKVYINLTDTEIIIQSAKYNPLDNTRWQYY